MHAGNETAQVTRRREQGTKDSSSFTARLEGGGITSGQANERLRKGTEKTKGRLAKQKGKQHVGNWAVDR
jgi:hypothetical protein